MNSVVIFGTPIANSFQLRYAGDSQTPVLEFGMAVPALKEGEKPTPVRVQVWGKQATEVNQRFDDAFAVDGLLVIGRTEINSVQCDGYKEQRAVFVASQVIFSDAPGTNVINLVGRLGADPDVKFFESGSVIAEFRIAVDRRSKQSNEPDWFSVEAWGKTAQVVADYVRKGGQVAVTGSIKWDVWDDRQTGAKRSKPIIRVDALTLLGSKRDRDEAPSYDDDFAPAAAPKAKPAKAAAQAVEPDYDDIPF